MTANPQRPEVDDPRVLALATARQQIAYESPLNFVCPPWDGLTSDEQQTSLLEARNYLHAAIAAGLVPVVSSPAATDRATLRDRVAEALHKSCMTEADAVGPMADAVLAVLPPTDRATVYREVADRLAADAEQGAKDGFTRIYRRSAAEQVRAWADELADDPSGDLIEDYLRFMRGQGPEPDLSELPPEQREAVVGQFEIVKALADRDPELPPLDRDPVARRLGLSVPAGGAQPEAPWATDGARIGRVLIWSWARVSDTEFGQGYRTAQEDVRAILTRPLLTPSAEAPQPAPAVGARQPDTETPACPDPIECSHEAALGQARETNRRLNLRAQRLESELAAYRRAVSEWQIDELRAYVPLHSVATIAKAAGLTVPARWTLHYERVAQAEAAIDRVRGWVTSDVVTARNEFGNGYREAQRDIRDLLDGRTPAAGGAGGVADETGEDVVPVHAVPLPGSNGISACCGRPPCEFVGERVTRDPDEVTCPGPAAEESL